MLATINFSIFIIAFILMGYLYISSLQPAKRSERRGEKAWKECKRLRSVSGVFELITILNLILWIWFPLSIFGKWTINPNIWIGVIIGIVMLIPLSLVMFLGIKDAGSETLAPSENTAMYGGIYKHIRHPQSLGEFPMYVAIGFMLNSWFLIITCTLAIVIYTPIMIHFEEKDLVKRFGDKYKEYQKTTGALFPRIKKQFS